MGHDPYNFDIDVDLSPMLGDIDDPTLISSYWYEVTQNRDGRPPELQAKMERTFRNAILRAQWRATSRRRLDRRRALRVPLISRVHIDDGAHLVATDISMSGLRCSGEPSAPVMDVEFRLPGNQIPIDARVEVVSFKEANVIPLVGMRFAWIDRPYVDCIAEYIARKRERILQAA
jgi:hypothetical protein